LGNDLGLQFFLFGFAVIHMDSSRFYFIIT